MTIVPQSNGQEIVSVEFSGPCLDTSGPGDSVDRSMPKQALQGLRHARIEPGIREELGRAAESDLGDELKPQIRVEAVADLNNGLDKLAARTTGLTTMPSKP